MVAKKPRNGSIPASNTDGRFTAGSAWHGFINVYLDSAAKQKAHDVYSDAAWVDSAVDAALGAGYRITLKMDTQSGAFSAFMTPTSPTHENAGWGLSERASSWWKALCRMLYIHHVVLDGNWAGSKDGAFVDDEW
jgi:hypothetical protein